MKLDARYFIESKADPQQVEKNLSNALKDLKIAKTVDIPEVRFQYAYTALIKGGIALLSHRQVRVKSAPGHHARIIEAMAQLLDDLSIETLGNLMRQKRNLDFYSGGIEVTQKECREYLGFVHRVLKRIKELVQAQE